MSKKKSIRKVNKLTIKECEVLLEKLCKDKESLHYNHILQHYRRLLPSMGSAVELSKVSVEEGEKAKHIKL